MSCLHLGTTIGAPARQWAAAATLACLLLAGCSASPAAQTSPTAAPASATLPAGSASTASPAATASSSNAAAATKPASSANTPSSAGTAPAAASLPTPTAGSAAAASASSGGACALATPADVTAAYGEPFGNGQASSPGGLSSCLFKQSGGGIDTVNVTLAQGGPADVTYSTNRTVYDASDLPGIGDKAFVSNDGGMIGVEKASTTILIHVVGFEKDAPAQLQAKQKALLQVCLTHAQ